MRILFDQGTPVPLRHALAGHLVNTVYEMGWAELENGELLKLAEATFDIFITTDQNLRYQQTSQVEESPYWCSQQPAGLELSAIYLK